jgi:hypothetical protein
MQLRYSGKKQQECLFGVAAAQAARDNAQFNGRFGRSSALLHRLLHYCKTTNCAKYRQVLHFCMRNFVSGNKANWALEFLLPETKLQ